MSYLKISRRQNWEGNGTKYVNFQGNITLGSTHRTLFIKNGEKKNAFQLASGTHQPPFADSFADIIANFILIFLDWICLILYLIKNRTFMKFLSFVRFFRFTKKNGFFDCLALFLQDLFVESAKQSVIFKLL